MIADPVFAGRRAVTPKAATAVRGAAVRPDVGLERAAPADETIVLATDRRNG
ncbi:hypothetical protein SUDANB95_00433 [Actinosynnema sp. ALI-1.44]